MKNKAYTYDEGMAILDRIIEGETLAEAKEDKTDWHSIFNPTPEEVAKIEQEIADRELAEFNTTHNKNYKRLPKNKCPKCSGNGRIDQYYYISGGVCFRCGGSGKVY